MEQSKLVALFRVLTKAQLQRFSERLPGMLVNKNTEILALFLYLSPLAPRFKGDQLKKGIVAKSLGISIKNLAYRSSDLLRALEQCIVIDQVLNDTPRRELILLQYYQQEKLDKHYLATARRIKKHLDNVPYQDADYWQYLSELKESEFRAITNYERIHYPELQAAADALDHAYLAKKLPYLLEMTSAGLVLDIPYERRLAEDVKTWSEQLPYQRAVIIKLYSAILKMVAFATEEAYFREARALLKAHESATPPALLKNFYTYLLNHCTQQIRLQNDPLYYEFYLDLNTHLIEKGMLLEHGFLPPWRYSNLVTVGLRTGRISWASDFLEKYRAYLPTAAQENIYHYNLAHTKYYEGDYETAQLLLNQLELSDLLLAIAAKNLLVKIYWENEEIEQLLHFLEAYRVYIYRQSLAKPSLKAQVKAFITTVRQMAKIPDFEQERKKELAKNLPPVTDILERDWLKKQLLK
ncbi:hypothetical protein [Lewinella cohaerens]|uniref:hypothetical protein n=1 Tax=Lewinella cohaerens TaxID=70995 RepID=UPI00037F2A23|nr:hypothetical protein [Lewinella cohaerens]